MNYEGFELFAWIGEDELGSGEVGLKQASCPAGMIPMAMVKLSKADQGYIREQLQAQVNRYGKPISLIRLRFVEELIRLDPQ